MLKAASLHTVLATFWRAFDLAYPLNILVYICFFPVLELLFYFRVGRYLKVRTKQKLAHSAADTAEVQRFWSRAIAEESPTNIDILLRGWFLGDGPLLAGNLLELIGWTLYAMPLAELSITQRDGAERVLARLMQRMAPVASFPPGYNSKRVCMLHTLEPLEPDAYKPLAFYLITRTARELAWALLRRRGYELRTHGVLSYWFHPGSAASPPASPASVAVELHATTSATSTTPLSPPLVVLHGVGGLVPYVPLLLALRRARPHNAQFVPLLPHCALLTPPYDPPPPLDTNRLVSGLAAALRAHAHHHHGGAASAAKAIFVGHSLGTAILASVAKSYPQLIGAAMLIDPICFLLYKRDVVYNFLYNCPAPLRHGPKQAFHIGYWFRLLLHYLLKREPTIQSAFRREFWWGRHWLHPEHLQCPSYVSLSGRDAIVPSHEVHSYLQERAAASAGRIHHAAAASSSASNKSGIGEPSSNQHMEIDLHPKRHHGWALCGPRARWRLVEKLIGLEEQMSKSARKGGMMKEEEHYHTEEDCDASTIYTEEEGEESTYAWSTAGSCATAPEEGELAALDVPVIF